MTRRVDAEALALRKQALVVRAASERRRVRMLAGRLGAGMRFPQAAGAILASPHGRRLAATLALVLFKGGRLGRLLRFGLGAFALARLARAVWASHAQSSPRPRSLADQRAPGSG